MRVVFSPLSLWPGFAGVVRRGLWDQLALALLFGLLCQATLFANFFWSDYLSGYVRASFGVVFIIAWIFLGAVASGRLKRYEKSLLYDADGELFLEAQTHYLRGEWFETECALKSVLKKNSQDAEALLLLATLYRHIKRFSEARQTLAALEKLESADYWRYEIHLEKEAIQTDVRALREERLAARQEAEREAANAETPDVAPPEVEETAAPALVASSEETAPRPVQTANEETPLPLQTTNEEATPPLQTPSLNTNVDNAPSPAQAPAPEVVSLETVARDVGTGRPILRFCLTSGNAKSDAA